MFHIEGKQPLSLLFIIPIIYSVSTFLKEKQKVHVFCIYFQIFTFLKMGVYTCIYLCRNNAVLSVRFL